MKCPYCTNEMVKGQIRAAGSMAPSIYWKDAENEFDLNTEPKLVSYVNGSRVDAYHCPSCKKIILDYGT